jgi:uncharacterized membrane protein
MKHIHLPWLILVSVSDAMYTTSHAPTNMYESQNVCFLTTALLGLIIIFHSATARHRSATIERITETSIFIIMIGLAGILGQLVETSFQNIFQNGTGQLVGIGIAAIVASYGNDIAHAMSKLQKPIKLALGIVLCALGSIGSLDPLHLFVGK